VVEDGVVSVEIEPESAERTGAYAPSRSDDEGADSRDVVPMRRSPPSRSRPFRDVTDEVGRLVRTTASRMVYASPVGRSCVRSSGRRTLRSSAVKSTTA
jgi:hypothetical protein